MPGRFRPTTIVPRRIPTVRTPDGSLYEGTGAGGSVSGHLYFAPSGTSGLSPVDLTPAGRGPAPSDAQYLTLAAHAGLSAERLLALTAPLTGTDGGAGGNYTLAIAPVGQQNGDLLSRQAGAWNRLAVGFESQRLSVVQGAPAWSWAALGSPRRILEAIAEYNSATWNTIGVAPSNLGTNQPLSDSDGTWMGRRTAGGAGAAAGWYWSNGYGRYDSTYRYRIRIKIDADLTNESFWCGIYDVSGARPTEAAAYTVPHVMFRYIHGTDAAVQLSTCDAGGTQTTSAFATVPAVSTAYFAELDFRTAGSVTARIYDANGTALGATVTKTTNLPSAATIMGRCMMVVSQGAGTHDVYASKMHLEAY